MRIAARERAPERRGAARSRDGPGGTGGRRGGGSKGPAQRASRGQVRPLATACCTRARHASRTGTEIELDGDVLERACARNERQLERA